MTNLCPEENEAQAVVFALVKQSHYSLTHNGSL
jgi:hypothetical protein